MALELVDGLLHTDEVLELFEEYTGWIVAQDAATAAVSMNEAKNLEANDFFLRGFLLAREKSLSSLLVRDILSIPPKRLRIYSEIISHGAPPPRRLRRMKKERPTRDALYRLISAKIRYLPSFFVRPKVFANMKRMTRMPT